LVWLLVGLHAGSAGFFGSQAIRKKTERHYIQHWVAATRGSRPRLAQVHRGVRRVAGTLCRSLLKRSGRGNRSQSRFHLWITSALHVAVRFSLPISARGLSETREIPPGVQVWISAFKGESAVCGRLRSNSRWNHERIRPYIFTFVAGRWHVSLWGHDGSALQRSLPKCLCWPKIRNGIALRWRGSRRTILSTLPSVSPRNRRGLAAVRHPSLSDGGFPFF